MDHEPFMRQCLALAEQAEKNDEVPVGALVTLNGEIIAEAANASVGCCDPTAHAEILAMRAAATHLGNYRLPGCTLYTTVEPCLMCTGTLLHARIERLVYGASEPRGGAISSIPDLLTQMRHLHKVDVVAGIMAPECRNLIQAFFKKRRSSAGKSRSNPG